PHTPINHHHPQPPQHLLPPRHYPRRPVLFRPSPRPHRDLPSFPTRRSSDLSMAAAIRFAACSASSMLVLARGRKSDPSCRRRDRSEEHTSELQSRFDLVCRLLLEKKKSCRRGPARRPAAAT